MAPIFTGNRFGFGNGGGSGGILFNISPALPGGQTSWDLSVQGDLTISEYSSRSFSVQSPTTLKVNLYGAGGGSNTPFGGNGGRGGNNQGTYVFSSGVTYWIHLGQNGSDSVLDIGKIGRAHV